MENECYKNYCFIPAEYDSRGRRMCDGKTFRDVVKEFEYDFHETYSSPHIHPKLDNHIHQTQS